MYKTFNLVKQHYVMYLIIVFNIFTKDYAERPIESFACA